jgi:hypothetical protein
MNEMPNSVRQLLPRLRDAGFTRVLVRLPEATPVHEAARLQDDLPRAGIAEVRDRLATRFAVIPWKPGAPGGSELLRELAGESGVFAGALKG